MELIIQILATVGGGGVIVIGLSKLLGNIWQDRLKEQERKRTELELETVRHLYNIRRVQADKFAGSQYDIYLELWETLQALRLTVDALWEQVTKQNVSNLVRQLRTTKQKVDNWSIFFDEDHLQQLRGIIKAIESFSTGKLSLEEIWSRNDLNYLQVGEIKTQVERNRHYRDQLEELLENLRRNFRDRLSARDSSDNP